MLKNVSSRHEYVCLTSFMTCKLIILSALNRQAKIFLRTPMKLDFIFICVWFEDQQFKGILILE